MRGSLAKARVVYAPVEEIGSEGRLMHACRILILRQIIILVLLFLYLESIKGRKKIRKKCFLVSMGFNF